MGNGLHARCWLRFVSPNIRRARCSLRLRDGRPKCDGTRPAVSTNSSTSSTSSPDSFRPRKETLGLIAFVALNCGSSPDTCAANPGSTKLLTRAERRRFRNPLRVCSTSFSVLLKSPMAYLPKGTLDEPPTGTPIGSGPPRSVMACTAGPSATCVVVDGVEMTSVQVRFPSETVT